MSGTAASKHPEPRPVSARARLRPKSQLTLPEEIRRALRVNEGDEVEFRIEENGAITVRGYTSIPTDHAWLYAAHQNTRQASDREFADKQATTYESADAPFIHPDAQGTADA
jgi:bifunctional DNA-binding transcriptional regulator/antitoxin component of YhaV-PrlF toxin-antitoxin module